MKIKWFLSGFVVLILSFMSGVCLKGCEQARGAEISQQEFAVHLGQSVSFLRQAVEIDYEFNDHRRGFESIFVEENQKQEHLDWAMIKLNVFSVLVQKLTTETEAMAKTIELFRENYGSKLINQAQDVINYSQELAIKQKEYLQWYDGLFKKTVMQ